MKSAIHQATRTSRKRRLLQCGTALPLLLAAWPSLAQPIVQQTDSDIAVDAASASGTPVAVELESTGGSITVNVDTVTATAGSGDRDYVVGLATDASGSITGTFGSITATGSGEVLGLGAESTAGGITLTVGSVDVSGAATAGVTASSTDGAVAISADSVIARGTGVDSQGEFFEAVLGTSNNNSVAIDVGHAETFGQSGSAIGAVAGGEATVVADSAVAHAEGVVVVYAQSAGNASLDLGTVTLTAEDGLGVYANSAGGNVTLAVDSINAGAQAEAARVLAAGDIDVVLGDVDSGGGMTATSTTGDVSVAVTGDIVGRTYGGLGLTGRDVSVTMAEGSSISAAGAGWNGIFVSAERAADIQATEIATTGANSYAINVDGGTDSVSIDSGSIRTAGSGAYGINVVTTGGDVVIASDTVTTTGAGQVFGISAITNGGDIAIDSGTISVASTGTDNGRAINANSGGGDIVINAGTTTGHTRAIYTTTLFSGGVLGFTAGNTTITSESATATGGNAIIAQGLSVALDSGRAEGTANPGFTAATIYVSAGEGGAAVTADETIAHGFGQYGIQVLSSGALHLASGSVTTDGPYGNGITAIGNAAISVASGSISTLGQDSHGIVVDGYTEYGSEPVEVVSETITTAGDRSNGLFVWSFNETAGMSGDITIDSGSIETGGERSHGIVVARAADPGYEYRPVSATAGTGALDVTSGSIVADGPGARGIVFDHAGPITLNSGSITADAGGIYMWAGSTADIVSDSVVTREGPGIVVYGAGDVTLDAGITEVGTNGSTGIYVETTTGDISIVADSTTTKALENYHGYAADAVVAVSTAGGDITVSAGTASSANVDGSAVVAISAGDVSINVGAAATTGAGGAAIYGGSSGGTLSIVADRITTSGANTGAVNALTTGGAVHVDVGSIVATGENARGIFAQVGAGGTTVDVGSISSTGSAVTLRSTAVPAGQATVNIAGAVQSGTQAINIQTASPTFAPNTLWTTVNVAEGASISGTTGIGLTATINNGQPLPAQLRSGVVFVNNDGTITGTSGTALDLGQASVTLANLGTIVGDVVTGGGVLVNRGTIDGDVTLNSQPGVPTNVFAYAAGSTLTGSVTGGAGIDTYGQFFDADGTAVIGGGLPTAFERYGVVTDSPDVTVVVEAAANPVGGTPSLMLMGEGRIVNRADLASTIIQGAQGAAPQVLPAVYSYGFATVETPFGPRFTFEGAGTGPAAFTNEANITGRVALTTSEFVNNGSIARSSAGVPSVVTARLGEAFSFSNTGTITMVDGGARVRTPAQPNGDAFVDFNPYYLPEPAMTIRSAISGTVDADGMYVPAAIANSGLVDGGLLVRMTASTFSFDNSGVINGFNGAQSSAPGLVITLGRNLDAGTGDPFYYDPVKTLASETASFTNSGEITDGTEIFFAATDVTFSNSGTMSGNANAPDALFLEHSADVDGVDAGSFTFVNTGEFDGNVGLELEAATVSITNEGSIVGRSYELNQANFPGVAFDGEAALEIDSETYGDSAISFVNTGTILNTTHAGSGVLIEAEAGDDDEDRIGNVTVSVVNSGTIAATGGATIVPQSAAPWLEPGQSFGNPIAGLAVDATDVNGTSEITIENLEGGRIEGGGPIHVAVPVGYFPIDVEQPDVLATAIYATGQKINIVNSGEIVGGPGTIHNPNVILEIDLYDNYFAGAIQTAGDEYENEDGDEVYIASIDHITNTATGSIVGSIDLGGNDDRLDNAGTITGDVFLRDGNDVLANSGTIVGNIDLGTGDDVLELSAASIIDGTVDLGEGADTVRLGATGANVGTVASTINAELLDVVSGSWRAEGVQSEYGLVRIAEAARLIVGENADGDTGIATAHVELDGRLDFDLVTDTEAGDLTGLLFEGTGSLHFVGNATVLLDDASGLQHTGGTFVDNGELLLTTEFGGDVTTSGAGVFELGATGDFTGNLVNNGTFVFAREADYDFLGNFSGTGLLKKYGASTLSFAGLYDFDGTTEIFGGRVIFTGQLAEDTEVDLTDGVLDLSNIASGEQTISGLEGSGGTLQLGSTNLIVDQSGNTTFAGQIQGTGTLEKTGEGDLKLEGDGTGFTGTGQVDGGTLSVNGNFGNANFEVNPGGRLGGSGTVGQTTVNGGTLAPGNSIGTLTVNGNVTFTPGSVYEVEVNPAGQSDRIDATGTATLTGARVNVIAENGTYRPLTDYTILTAAGGIEGTFASVQDNLAFLDPSLIYSANAVTLRLVRNDIDFAAFGATANQSAIGGLIESYGYGNTLYNETLLLADTNVAISFASLTGEVYPAHSAALVETAEMLRRQTAGAMRNAEGAFLWATGVYNSVDSGNGPGSIELSGQGVAGGFGYAAGGFYASAGLGLLDQGSDTAGFTDGDVTFAVGRVGYDFMSGLSVNAGVQLGWADGDTRRQTALGAINQAVSGQIEGDYVQVFGEIAYRLAVGGGLEVEPFVGLSHVSVDLDGVTEAGAATALAVGAIERDVTFGNLGLRLSGEVGSGVRPFASAAYRHAWGDRASLATVGFAGNPGAALIGAAPIAQSSAELAAGLQVSTGSVDFEFGYEGSISNSFDSHGVHAGVKLRF